MADININWYPGHMITTKNKIQESLKMIDIVYEILDARIPYSSKIKDIDSLIKNKTRILIMTKSDLCDLNITNKWVDYYKSLGYEVILVDLINNINIKKILELTNKVLIDINNKRIEKGMKQRVYRAMVIGIPNVGKSTLINRLVNKKVCDIGNKPGVTKKLNWIRIKDNIELLDTPGILWPKLDSEDIAYNLASMYAIRDDILDEQSIATYILNKMDKLYKNELYNKYNIKEEDFKDLEVLYKKIGIKKNIIGKEVDYDRIYKVVINDLRSGVLGKVTFDETNI
ncbi:MAG TPA: ribosome biogenesis GTPase YlqF [Bacilli bacterium]|nr:ribosome biogenesis GTPase YlqF [Bacilli bacterium]